MHIGYISTDITFISALYKTQSDVLPEP